jgi:tetratricopeptide (TPR) repeat protein
MLNRNWRFLFASIGLVAALSGARGAPADDASGLNADILRIAQSWAHVKFEVTDTDLQQKQIADLARQAAALIPKYPGKAEPIIWQGILLSEGASMANEAGSMFTARSLAYKARDVLLQAEKMDPAALDGGAPTSLGVLYYRVPHFPIAFGDTEKARRYLEEAMRYAPDGMDANYFYGDFLMQEKDYPDAIRVWKHALSLPPNTTRPLWDQSRRLVIQQALAKLSTKG